MALNLKRKRTVGRPAAGGKRRHVQEDDEASVPRPGPPSDPEISDEGEDGSGSGEKEHSGDEGAEGEEAWGGIGGDEVAGESAPTPDAAHPSRSRLKVPPSGEELRAIKDATDLYRSSSFKLQIDALLPNVRPSYSKSAPLDHFLLALHTLLLNLPSVSPRHPLAGSRELLEKGIAVPYALPLPTEDTNWKVAFERPSEIVLAGSWALKTSVKAKDGLKYTVDVAVTMPESLFQEKDYLNGRYFHKRAYYMAVVAAAIADKKSALNLDVLYESVSGDPRLTNLILRQKQDGSANDFTKLNVQVRLLFILPSSSPIPLSRLSPARSNIRSSSSSSPELSTPLYNTALLLSLTPKPHLLTIHNLKESVPAFADALALLRVWAHQRGYGTGSRLCVRGFEGRGMFWVSVLTLLINGEAPAQAAGLGKKVTKRRPLGKGLSSYQLFKAALDFLARHDFNEDAVFVKSTKPDTTHRFPPQDYNAHEAVLVDADSMVNVLAGVPLSSLDMLRYDARITLDALDHALITDDPFQYVFLKEQRDIATRFDIVARVDLSSAKLRKPSADFILDHGSMYNALVSTLVSTLRRGLGNRAKAIAVLHPSSQPRLLSNAQPANSSVVYVGLVLDTEHAFRLVDHGPTAAEQETEVAKEFREFWGDKAELRRFKDGSITESVVWEVKSADERGHIPSVIMRHLLQRHCGIAPEAVHTWQSQFDGMLRLPPSIASIYQAAAAPTGFKAAMAAYDTLVKQIKALDEELPLAILNVSPIADALRYTSPFNPVSLPSNVASALPPSARYLAPMELILEFEKSTRWPDDLRAIQKIKLAFLERLASALMTAHPGLVARVVVGDGMTTSEIQDQSTLEVITAEGWAFLARIWHDREATLLERAIDDKPHIPKHLKRQMQSEGDSHERVAALAAREVYGRRFVHAPRHHRAIAALSHRYTAYSGTVRLVKRWLAAHWLLRGHVSEEVVELLCASVFLGSGSSSGAEPVTNARASAPGSKERGFAQVVELLKDWEWEKGLFVPLYGSAGVVGALDKPVAAAGTRQGVWSVATEMDPDGHIWTSSGPDAIVARRVGAIARATWECLQNIESSQLDVKSIFAHPTEHYDFIVQLDPAVLPRYCQNVNADSSVWAKKGKYANLQSVQDVSGSPLPGFDPARLFYDDLQRVYKDTFMLFSDPLGGDRFGVVWDPILKNPRSFRVFGGFSSTPARKGPEKSKDKDKALVVLNEGGVLGEIQRTGASLIRKIVVQH
ncbi:Nrap protein [Obba rivulosa]|uniref:U3 small nucleolar RNA-associated protein 22 n=1 Tax=Obba rivulosa TaxID=1052685 RepID=A0A8E2AL30_9APHY|nr:Nrap protein [Obba rivulosa]